MTRYRGLVAPAFRPSVLRKLEEEIRTRVRVLLDAGPTEIVGDLAVPLPLQVICLMLGIPEDDWPKFFRWSEAFVPGVSTLPQDELLGLRVEAGMYLVGEAHAGRAPPSCCGCWPGADQSSGGNCCSTWSGSESPRCSATGRPPTSIRVGRSRSSASTR